MNTASPASMGPCQLNCGKRTAEAKGSRNKGIVVARAWMARELRHSFVSIMSDQGVPIEVIADLVGHANPGVTGTVYRHQLKPVIRQGAQTMNSIFGSSQS